MRGMRPPRYLLVGLIVICTWTIPVWAQMHRDFLRIGARNINRGIFGFPNQFSAEQELHEAVATDSLMRQQLELSGRHEIAAYIRRLSEEIGRHSDFNGDLRLCLTRNQREVAFATMAGYLYIDERIVKIADNESELAGVLAHEIAHLAARHGAENMTRKHLIERNPTWMMTMLFPSAAFRDYRVTDTRARFWIAVHHSMEIEADELATQYLWNSGFDPEGLLNLLDRIEARNWLDQPGGRGQSLSHPQLSMRQKSIRAVLDALPSLPAARLSSSDFAAAQESLRSHFISLSRK